VELVPCGLVVLSLRPSEGLNVSRIGILNYGTGNLSSVQKSFSEILECPSVVVSPADLESIDALVLPGVGHFGFAMRYLIETGLFAYLPSIIKDGLPTLGICLGFQLMCEYSEEDLTVRGLGLLPFGVSRLSSQPKTNVKVPQIGWNSVKPTVRRSSLFEGIDRDETFFYFANSFGVRVSETPMINTVYSHGDHYFASLESASIFGVQFHPEKSGEQGLKVLENFARTVR